MSVEPHRVPIEPELDLHPFQPRDIASVVEEYINEAHAAGLREVRLVHGRGIGVQRGIVQQACADADGIAAVAQSDGKTCCCFHKK